MANRKGMRPCVTTRRILSDDLKYEIIHEPGWFLTWATDTDSDGHRYPVAIVEREDGRVVVEPAINVIFKDVPKQGGPIEKSRNSET